MNLNQGSFELHYLLCQYIYKYIDVINLLKDWPRNWLFSRQATPDSVGESGLHWLIPLWGYRDTEVSKNIYMPFIYLSVYKSQKSKLKFKDKHN